MSYFYYITNQYIVLFYKHNNQYMAYISTYGLRTLLAQNNIQYQFINYPSEELFDDDDLQCFKSLDKETLSLRRSFLIHIMIIHLCQPYKLRIIIIISINYITFY